MAKRKIVLNRKFEYLRPNIEGVPDTVHQDGEIIFRHRNVIYRTMLGGVDVTVKAFHVPALFNRIIYSYFRHSKARRSYENALKLLSLGVSTPEPIAYIEEYCSGLLTRSYYICRWQDGQEIRHWETAVANYKEMVHELGGFMFELHEKGIFHRDFSPGNILFTIDEYGKYHFHLLDINRMQFGVSDRKKLYRNFRALNIESETETVRVGREYSVWAHLNRTEMEETARQMLHDYYKEKARHRWLKRIFLFRR